MTNGQKGSYEGTPASSMTLKKKHKDGQRSPASAEKDKKTAKGSSQDSNLKNVSKNGSKNVSKFASCYKASASPMFKGRKGAPECGRCQSDQFIREGLSCYLCDDMFHACCREPGAGSTSSTAICPKSSYTAVSTLIRKEASESHKDRWGQFMFMCNRCKKRVADLKNNSSCPVSKSKLVSVACDTGVSYEDKSSNTDSKIPETMNCLQEDESPEPTLSEKNLEKLLKTFKDQVLDSVDNLMSQKLDSINNIMTRTPRPSSDSSVADSLATMSESSLLSSSSKSSGYTSYLRAFQSTPLPMNPGKCTPSASTSSIDKAVKSIRREVDDSSSTEDHVVVLRSEDDSVNVVEEKGKVTHALKTIPIADLKENKMTNKIVLRFPSGQAKEKAKSTLEKTLEGSKILIDEGKKMFPKITVTNIPNYLVSHILQENCSHPERRELLSTFVKEKFLDKNEVVNKMVATDKKTFDVVYVKSGENFTTVGIKVSPVIRKYLIEQGCIYIGETRCKVVDRIDLKQCFKCQRVGHISSQCRSNTVVCMYCGSSHRTTECRVKEDSDKHRCINCSHSNIEEYRNNCDSHHSGHKDCPILQQEKLRLQGRTEYSKNI